MATRAALVVPNYNGAEFLEATLRSLCAQNYDNFEVVLIDNASTDNSLEVARAIGHPRLRIVAETEHVHMGANYWRAVKVSDADYVALCASDELYEPDWLATLAPLLDADTRAFCAACRSDSVDRYGNTYWAPEEIYKSSFWPATETATFDPETLLELLMQGCFIVFTTCLFRREVLDEIGPFAEDIGMVGDWQYFFRAAWEGYSVVGSRKPLAHYRRHNTSVSDVHKASLRRFRDEQALMTWVAERTGAKPNYRLVRRTGVNHFAQVLASGNVEGARQYVPFILGLGGPASQALAAVMRAALKLGPRGGQLMLAGRDLLLKQAYRFGTRL